MKQHMKQEASKKARELLGHFINGKRKGFEHLEAGGHRLYNVNKYLMGRRVMKKCMMKKRFQKEEKI